MKSKWGVILGLVLFGYGAVNLLAAQDGKPEKPTQKVAAEGQLDSVDSKILRQGVDFSTGYLATPITIPNDPRERKITALELKCSQLRQRETEGTFLIDKSEVSFNEFGDGKVVRRRPKDSLRVTLRRVAIEGAPDDRQLYKLQFSSGVWPNRIYFVRSLVDYAESRLFIRAEKTPGPIRTQPGRFVLGGAIKLRHLLPEASRPQNAHAESEAIREKISLTSHHFHFAAKGLVGPLGYIRIDGDLTGKGRLVHDTNHVVFTPLGDVGSSTLIGFGPRPFTFSQVKLADQSGHGRRLYRMAMLDGNRRQAAEAIVQYSLALSPRLGGPHRLIIKSDGKVRHVLPMHDGSWRRFLFKKRLLDRTSKPEQKAITAIRKINSTRFDFAVKANKVTSISLSGDSVSDATLRHLESLKHLKRLSLSGCRRTTAAGLQSIANLLELETLSFYMTPVSDAGLSHVAHLKKLKALRIYDEPPRGVALADVPQVSDQGLKSLVGLENLQSLDLYGRRVTDAGLQHLAGLTKLRRLYFHQTEVTPRGLIKISDKLRNAKIESTFMPLAGSDDSYSLTIHSSQHLLVTNGDINDDVLSQLTSLDGVKSIRISNMGEVTDKGLSQLGRFKELRRLSLQHSRVITDAGLKEVGHLQHLEQLSLWYCRNITDLGLQQLHGLSKLRLLSVGGTKVTKQGIATLQQNLTACKVER